MSAVGGHDVGTLLNTFVAELGRETRLLQQLVTLRTRPADMASRQRMAPLLSQVDSALSRLEASVEALQSIHASRASVIADDAARVRRHARTTEARIAAIRSHLPPELVHALTRKEAEPPKPQEAPDPVAGSVQTHADFNQHEKAPETPVRRPAKETAPKQRTALQRAAAAGSAQPSEPAKASARHRADEENVPPRQVNVQSVPCGGGQNLDMNLPFLENVTPEQLSNAPQYVRGRLTVERVAKVIVSLNKVIQSKYKFMARSQRTLSTDEVTRRHDIQSLQVECSVELKGRPFFTDADIKLQDGVAFDSNTKAVINVLRHVSALKEVRAKNKTRIFILSNM